RDLHRRKPGRHGGGFHGDGQLGGRQLARGGDGFGHGDAGAVHGRRRPYFYGGRDLPRPPHDRPRWGGGPRFRQSGDHHRRRPDARADAGPLHRRGSTLDQPGRRHVHRRQPLRHGVRLHGDDRLGRLHADHLRADHQARQLGRRGGFRHHGEP